MRFCRHENKKKTYELRVFPLKAGVAIASCANCAGFAAAFRRHARSKAAPALTEEKIENRRAVAAGSNGEKWRREKHRKEKKKKKKKTETPADRYRQKRWYTFSPAPTLNHPFLT